MRAYVPNFKWFLICLGFTIIMFLGAMILWH